MLLDALKGGRIAIRPYDEQEKGDSLSPFGLAVEFRSGRAYSTTLPRKEKNHLIRQKRLQIDQRKIDRVKRLLGVKTHTMENKSVPFSLLITKRSTLVLQK